MVPLPTNPPRRTVCCNPRPDRAKLCTGILRTGTLCLSAPVKCELSKVMGALANQSAAVIAVGRSSKTKPCF